MEQRLYTRDQAIAKMSRSAIEHLEEHGLVSGVKVGERQYYDAVYIDNLLATRQKLALGGPQRYDPYFAHLFYINLLYEDFTATDWTNRSRQRKRAFRAIRERLDTLVDEGGVVTVSHLMSNVPSIRPWDLNNWVTRGSLVVITIGKVRYFSTRYADRVVWALLQCETVSAAAERLRVPLSTLQGAVGQGRLPAFDGPDGKNRIDPTVPQWVALESKGLTVREVADRLGVGMGAVDSAIDIGRIKALPAVPGRMRTVDEAEVARWGKKFAVLPRFGWLQAQLEAKGRPVAVMTVAQAARSLKVSVTTVQQWCRRGLLPHYVRSFGEPGTFFIVRRYVTRLLKFAPSRPVTMGDAKDFRRACTSAEDIL